MRGGWTCHRTSTSGGNNLGDGVYAERDEAGQLWLRTERDGGVHEIALDPVTWRALIAYATRVWPGAGRPWVSLAAAHVG
jgi:hypothetical protein